MNRKPSFFIEWPAECGTVRLCRCLRGHSEVFLPGLMKTLCFGSALRCDRSACEDEYLRSYADANEGAAIGEVTPRTPGAPLDRQCSPAFRDRLYRGHMRVVKRRGGVTGPDFNMRYE
jgi:hypothetical protein